MFQLNALRNALQPHLGWHGARLTFLAMFLIALFRVKTVNFAELATAFPSQAQSVSSYKRLQRFFRDFELDYEPWTQLIVRLLNIPQPWTLSLDRTNWEFGGTAHNILMLGVVHQGVAIPLLWWMLDKRGNSATDERITLVEEFLAWFPDVKVADLMADREFIGQDWFAYLLGHPALPFRIRIRETEKLWDGRQGQTGQRLFQPLRIGEQQVLRHRRRLWGHWVYVAALRLEDGDLLIVVTNHAPKSAIADYAKRWGIETLFGCLKTRGFCLESTHLTDMERLSKLIALLSLALAWAIHTGEWLTQQKPLPIKKHGRKATSIFRYGLDRLTATFRNLELHTEQFIQLLNFLSCT
jgi:Transposase DDE domain